MQKYHLIGNTGASHSQSDSALNEKGKEKESLVHFSSEHILPKKAWALDIIADKKKREEYKASIEDDSTYIIMTLYNDILNFETRVGSGIMPFIIHKNRAKKIAERIPYVAMKTAILAEIEDGKLDKGMFNILKQWLLEDVMEDIVSWYISTYGVKDTWRECVE